MANGNTDVELVIRARDEASKALLTVSDAIKSLVGTQNDLVRGSGATSSLLDQLRSATGSLAAALDNADASLERAQAQFERQTKVLADTKQQLAAVTAQSEAATAVLARLNAQFASGPQLANFYTQLAGVTAEQKNLTAQANQLTAAVTKQESAVVRARTALEQLQSANRAAGSATTFASAASPTAVGANADETARATQINRAFEIMALEAADAAEKEGVAMRSAAEGVAVLARNLPPIAPAAEEASGGLRSLRTSLLSTIGAFLSVPSAAERAAAAETAFGVQSTSSTQAVRLLRYELFSLALAYAGPYGIIAAIGSVLTAYQALQSAENKLGVVFNQNTEQVGTEMAWLREQATRLGLSFTQLADQYSTVAVSAQEAGFSLDGTRKLFLSIVEAARVLHLSTDDVNRVFLAFREILSKGVVQSVQLVKQLGADMPAAVQIFADAFGVSEAKLLKMMKAGQVFADQDTLSKVADRLSEKYGKQLPQALETAQTQIGRFQSLLQQAEIEFGQGGFIDHLSGGLKQLNVYLQSGDARNFFASLGQLFGRLVSLIPIIAHNFDLITAAFKAWFAIKIDIWLLGLLSKMGGVATAARAMWVAIGGLPGLLLTGAAFLLQGYLGDWLTGIDKATTALDEHQRILDAVQKGYDDAGRKVDGWAQKIKDTTAAQVLANLNTLKAQAALTQTSLPEVGPQISGAGSRFPTVVPNALRDQLNDIIQKFKDGKSSYEDFKKALSDFGVAHPQFLDFTKDVLDQAEKFGKLQDAIKQADAAMHVLQGHATSADLKTLGLDQANGWQAATNAASKFSEALDTIRKQAPDLKRQLQFQTNLDNAKAAYDQAIKAAGSDPAMLQQAKQLYDQVVAKVHAYAAADAAKNFPLDNKAIIERIIYVESQGNVTAKNPNSSAYGIGQFTAKTWLDIFDQIRPALSDLSDAAKLSLRSNETIAREALELLTKQNQLQLANAGIPTTAANTYLAHFLGPQTAIKMILANPKELAADIASSAAVRSNPSILGGNKTVQDVLNFTQTKMGGASPIMATGQTEVEKFTDDLNAQIQAWKDDAKAAQDAGAAQTVAQQRALVVQKAVDEWTKKAASDKTTLSKEQIDAIHLVVGALFDVQHAAENAQKSIDQVVGLSEQRKTAIEELHTAFSDGSSAEQIDALKQKVADLTAQLKAVLPPTQAVVATLGDTKMVANLDKVNQQLVTLKTGLTDAKQINTLIADSFTNAWANFTQTLQQTHSVLKAVWQTFLSFAQDFLQQIENMILKQLILNALSQTNIGGTISGAINSATGTDAAAGAALTTAGTTLNTAGVTLNTSGGLLSSAAAALQAAATALSAGGGGGGGIGGLLGSLFGDGGMQTTGNFSDLLSSADMMTMHTGGIVGTNGMRRSIAMSVFAKANRYHGGGLPGLSADEVPTILQRGEEVLRRDDTRHIFNGGGSRAEPSAPPVVKLKVVNTLDSGDIVSEGLGTTAGERAILNLIRANSRAVRAILT